VGRSRAINHKGVHLWKRTYRCKKTGKQKTCTTYHARVWVAGRMHERSTRLRLRRAAEHWAAKWVEDLELRAAGIETYLETRSRSLSSLVVDWERDLERRKRNAKHRRNCKDRVLRILETADELSGVTPAWVRRRLNDLRSERNLGDQTTEHYRTALGSFFSWLVLNELWSRNPVSAVQGLSKIDAQERRALTEAERGRLLRVAPIERRTCYQTAMTTGFRRRELRSLRWRHVDLPRRLLRLEGEFTKNRRAAELPLPRSTVEALVAWRAALEAGCWSHRGPKGKLPPGSKRTDSVFGSRVPRMRTFGRDLEAAMIPVQTEEGVVVFHSLRATFSTWLKDQGVSLGARQALMRHSDPALTEKSYTTRWGPELRAAVDLLDGRSGGGESGRRKEVLGG